MQSGSGLDLFHSAKYGFFDSGLSQGQNGRTCRPGGFARRIEFEERGAGGEDIVDKQQIAAAEPLRIGAQERAIEVLAALFEAESGLSLSVPRADEPLGAQHLSAGGTCNAMGDGRRLVVSSFAQARGV